MALFFDTAWFDAALAAQGADRPALGAALGLDAEAMEAIWKDQRELSEDEVRVMARFLDRAPAEIADRAGVSTPVPQDETKDPAPDGIEERLARLEREVAHLKRDLALALGRTRS